VTVDIVVVISVATAIVGFLSLWVKMGIEKGENKKAAELLEQKTNKHEADINELKNTTHNIQLDIAKSMGKIEAKLDSMGKIEAKIDSIGERVAALKGGRRAAEK
jgi:peptidoglycan hydrolase CwlO-like protein